MQSLATNPAALCARLFLSGREDDAHWTQKQLDWTQLESAAERHSMMPLMAYVVRTYLGDSVPEDVHERLEQHLRSTARRNLIWLAEWQRIQRAFASEGIGAISLKGPAFTLLAYGNIALRESTDLDFLVKPDDVPKARNLLTREGYCIRFPAADGLRSSNRQLDFVNPERGAHIDLHWGALHAMFPFQLPIEALFASARIERVEDLPVLSLSPEYLLLYLCAHGTKHCWLHMRWLCDVVCHIHAAQDLDWDLCIRHAGKANCDLVLKHSLLLAMQVLGLELPVAVKHYCDGADVKALANAALSFLLDENDIGRRKVLRYHMAFAKDWRSRIRLAFCRVFVPEEQDWETVRLARSLRLGYYVVRPLRFAWKWIEAKL